MNNILLRNSGEMSLSRLELVENKEDPSCWCEEPIQCLIISYELCIGKIGHMIHICVRSDLLSPIIVGVYITCGCIFNSQSFTVVHETLGD